MAMKVADGIFCDLRHGVKLEIYSEPGELTIHMAGDFLAKAMEHFKHHRDVLKTEQYKGNPFCLTFSRGRGRKAMRLATMQLTQPCQPGDKPLTAALWTDAVISAYCSVNSVEQMVEDLPAWQQAVAREGETGFLREVVSLLDKPGGDMQAMQMMLKHRMARDLEQGYYRPGEITDILAAAKAQSDQEARCAAEQGLSAKTSDKPMADKSEAKGE